MRRTLLVLLLLGALAAAAPAAAGAALTATQIRIGDHPAFVRVVVDFTGGTVGPNQVESPDPAPFDGRARVRVTHAGITSNATRVDSNGVVARVVKLTGAIVIKTRFAEGRFKYLEHFVLHAPERVVIDLWKARPPSPGAEFLTAPQGGCLTLDGFSSVPGKVSAHGEEHGLFEHMFQVALRKHGGALLRVRSVTASGGLWHRSVTHTIGRQQVGTLEAVDFSEQDGSLACIVQARVTLKPAP
jgi:hypothetical protein